MPDVGRKMPTYTCILTEISGRVGLIRFNRPKSMNAINNCLLEELGEALEGFDGDPQVGAIVLTGSEGAFAAGADIKEMADSTPIDMLIEDRISRFDRIRQTKKPVIAAVSGWCLGGGNEIAMACDMIVASETARFGQPEINLGVIPGAGGTQRLTRAVGKAVAMEVILNNRTLSAEEALHYGLVNRVVPVERFLEEALSLAQEIAARAPLAIRMAKESINNAFETYLRDGLSDERRAFYLLFASNDQKEGMRAFIDKRPPAWQGK
jgi:enoyl-CoA hydratase